VKFILANEVCQQFPQLCIGVLVSREIDNTGCPEELAATRAGVVSEVRLHTTTSQIDTIPEFLCWQDAYSEVGHKPKKNKPSAEALTRFVVSNGELRSFSPVVDLYLCAQLVSRWPVGGYDLRSVEGDIFLRKSQGSEKFIERGGIDKGDTTRAGEVVYSDSSRVLTRRWNWRDGGAAEITKDSKDVVLMVEAFADQPSGEESRLKETVDDLGRQIQRFCGGTFSTFVINAKESCEIDLQYPN
jgi:DNA/RNA-binding domain of Phe-tRNA-synthetase-like protein